MSRFYSPEQMEPGRSRSGREGAGRHGWEDRLVHHPLFLDGDEQRQTLEQELPRRRSRWPGIVAFALAAVALLIVLRNWPFIQAFLATMGGIGSRSPGAQVKGLVSVGVVLVSILAALRIVLDSNRRNDK